MENIFGEPSAVRIARPVLPPSIPSSAEGIGRLEKPHSEHGRRDSWVKRPGLRTPLPLMARHGEAARSRVPLACISARRSPTGWA
jgi:hypothetical protein